MRRACVAAAAAMLLGGCFGALPAMRQHTLLAADGAPVAGTVPRVAVDVVSVPPAVDRRQLVLAPAPGETLIDDANGWASPLRQEIARALAARWAPGGTTPDYRITVAITRFDSMPRQGVRLAAEWTLRGSDGTLLRQGNSSHRAPAATTDLPAGEAAALVAAHRTALAALADELALALGGAR